MANKITCEQLNRAMQDHCLVMFRVCKPGRFKEVRWHPHTDLFSVRVVKPSPYISSITENIPSAERAVELYNAIVI